MTNPFSYVGRYHTMLELDCDEETDGCPELVRPVSFNVFAGHFSSVVFKVFSVSICLVVPPGI